MRFEMDIETASGVEGKVVVEADNFIVIEALQEFIDLLNFHDWDVSYAVITLDDALEDEEEDEEENDEDALIDSGDEQTED